ncbi:MAG: hypothetical protein HQ521_10730 [Bacteroidetes bacterium]|nr:hypothetical protein [Bacteroidota bacterium]
MKRILKMDLQLKKEIEISRTQISNLLYDVNDNLVDTTFLKEYIKEEKRIVLILVNRINHNLEIIRAETNRYDSLNPIIENYLNKNN